MEVLKRKQKTTLLVRYVHTHCAVPRFAPFLVHVKQVAVAALLHLGHHAVPAAHVLAAVGTVGQQRRHVALAHRRRTAEPCKAVSYVYSGLSRINLGCDMYTVVLVELTSGVTCIQWS